MFSRIFVASNKGCCLLPIFVRSGKNQRKINIAVTSCHRNKCLFCLYNIVDCFTTYSRTNNLLLRKHVAFIESIRKNQITFSLRFFVEGNQIFPLTTSFYKKKKKNQIFCQVVLSRQIKPNNYMSRSIKSATSLSTQLFNIFL